MTRVLGRSALLLLFLAVAGCETMNVRATREFTLTQPWQSYERVEVRIRNGGVDLRVDEVSEIHVTGTKFANGATPADAEANVDQIDVVAGPHPSRAHTFLVELHVPDTLRSKSPGANISVRIPRACAANLQTSNGAIRAFGLAGDVVLKTSNGPLQIHDIRGRVQAETSNGQIDARGVTGGLAAESSNGRIHAEDIRGECTLTTSNGAIRVLAAADALEHTALHTSNGAIHVTVPPQLAADLELRTSNGQFSTRFASGTFDLVEQSRSRLVGRLNGGGVRIEATTSNGPITVDTR